MPYILDQARPSNFPKYLHAAIKLWWDCEQQIGLRVDQLVLYISDYHLYLNIMPDLWSSFPTFSLHWISFVTCTICQIGGLSFQHLHSKWTDFLYFLFQTCGIYSNIIIAVSSICILYIMPDSSISPNRVWFKHFFIFVFCLECIPKVNIIIYKPLTSHFWLRGAAHGGILKSKESQDYGSQQKMLGFPQRNVRDPGRRN